MITIKSITILIVIVTYMMSIPISMWANKQLYKMDDDEVPIPIMWITPFFNIIPCAILLIRWINNLKLPDDSILSEGYWKNKWGDDI